MIVASTVPRSRMRNYLRRRRRQQAIRGSPTRSVDDQLSGKSRHIDVAVCDRWWRKLREPAQFVIGADLTIPQFVRQVLGVIGPQYSCHRGRGPKEIVLIRTGRTMDSPENSGAVCVSMCGEAKIRAGMSDYGFRCPHDHRQISRGVEK